MATKRLLKSCLWKIIGACLNTSVVNEPWLLDTNTHPLRDSDRVTYRHQQLIVHSFIRHDTREWDTPLLRVFFKSENKPLILGLWDLVLRGPWMITHGTIGNMKCIYINLGMICYKRPSYRVLRLKFWTKHYWLTYPCV